MKQDRKFSRILNISLTAGGIILLVLVALFNPKKEKLQAQELSCEVICDGQESYIEPEYYPEGFDYDYEKLIYAEVRDSGKLIFDVSWDTNTLIVSEDYYHYDVTSSLAGRVERNTYELQANEEGGFELEVAHRNKVRDEQAVYFIQGEKGVFVIKVLFLASENTPSAVVEPILEEEISGDHVLKEINAVVEGNRTLTMRAIGKKREDMDLWGLCQIDVYEGSTKIQVIHLKDIIDIDGFDGSVDQGYTECWSKEELLQAKDVNFDGNQDMEIFAWITNTSIPYYYMLWNRNSGQFEYGFRIQLTEVDYDNQQLVASHREGAGTYYTDYYRYNENGELYLADVEIKDSEGNLINRKEPEWAETTEEEKLGNGQYLADMDWESLKTRITDTEYQAVQKYLPVLEGEDFTWIYRSGEGREPDTYIHDKKRISIEKWIQESYERNEQEPQKPVINSFVFADVFQSGQENICILFRHLGFHWLILHEEEGVIYGIDMPVRWFGGVQKDGLYYGSGGAADAHYKRMIFENGDYTEHEIAHISYEELYQNGEKKSAEELAEWEKDNIKEPAQVYYPKEE